MTLSTLFLEVKPVQPSKFMRTYIDGKLKEGNNVKELREKRNYNPRPVVHHDITSPRACNKCKVIRPASAFNFYDKRHINLLTTCKFCIAEYQAYRRKSAKQRVVI